MIELCCDYLSVRCIWLYVFIMSRTSSRVNPHPIVCSNVKELLAWGRRHIWSSRDINEIRTHNHLVRKRTLKQCSNIKHEYLSVGCVWLYIFVKSHTSFRVNPHSIVCLNFKDFLARSKRHIWSLSDGNEIRTYKLLVRKRTLNHLAKMAKWLSFVVSA